MASAKRLSILDWIALYGEPLSIILADTFGHKATFDAINRELARIIRGFRQDSGPPVEFGEQAIRFFAYRGLTKEEIANKMIIFSDSLNLEKMLDIYLKMAGRIRSTFGVGTYLTNDMGLPALNIVAKLIAVLVDGEWVPTVKLSADRGKNLGPDDLVERYKRVFKYDEPLGF